VQHFKFSTDIFPHGADKEVSPSYPQIIPQSVTSITVTDR